MSKITPLVSLVEGKPYLPGPYEWVVREDHSIEDVLVHLVLECGGDKRDVEELLRTL